MSSWEDDEIGPTLRAVVLTAAHEPTTREKLRTIVGRSLIGQSTLGEGRRERLTRSALISSQLMGFALVRYVWKIEPAGLDDRGSGARRDGPGIAALRRR